MKKVVIIDGQGGRIGALLVEMLKTQPEVSLCAVGTNSIATSAMLKAGAAVGATGENPVVVNCRDADIIVGPIGIVIADAMAGEVTPQMAAAVGASPAERVLLSVGRCNNHIVGAVEMSVGEAVAQAAELVKRLLNP